MDIPPEVFILEVGQVRATVLETFRRSLNFLAPDPVPVRLYNSSAESYHFIYVRLGNWNRAFKRLQFWVFGLTLSTYCLQAHPDTLFS